MNYQEHVAVIRNVAYEYLSEVVINKDIENYVTIGFKYNKPVLKLPNSVTKAFVSQESLKEKEAENSTSEKRSYIYINGQKVGVVPAKLNMPVKFNKVVVNSLDKNNSVAQQVVILKPCEASQISNLKFLQTFNRLPSSNTLKMNTLHNASCDTDLPSQAHIKNESSEICIPQESSDFDFNKNINFSMKTYSKSTSSKSSDNLIRTNNLELPHCDIDYEKRITNNIRTYKSRKNVATSCHDLYTMIEVSVQTENVQSGTNQKIDIGIQTDNTHINQFIVPISKQDNSEESVVMSDIFDDRFFNFIEGSEQPAISLDAAEKLKLQFHEDFQNCLTVNSKGNLPIHEGVLTNDAKLVKRNCVVLKARQENIDVLNNDNLTPLQMAVLNETADDIISILLKYDADLSVMDSEGNSVLHLAVDHMRLNALKILLEFLKDADIDCFNYEGLSPLMLCCINKSHAMATILLNNGADPNVKDLKSGRTALFHAAENHDLDMVKLLLAHKANTKIRNFFGTSPHDAMFEVEDIPKGIKYEILGKDLHIRSQQKKRILMSKADSDRKKSKYGDKTLTVIPTMRSIGHSVNLLKKS